MKSYSLPAHIKSALNEGLGTDKNVMYTRAPGRINLIGEHTDYNGGLVLPAAIDKYMYFAFVPNGTRTIDAHALDKEQPEKIELDNITESKNEWANFLIGILIEFEKRGVELQGFDCAFTSEVPIGAGMSSSSALECAFLVGLNQLFDIKYDNWELIKISQSSNHNFLGIKGGIMDQFASLFGQKDKLMLLDCNSLDFDYVTFPSSPYSWLLINTCVKHNHLSSGYNDRVKECAQALKDIREVFPETEHLCDIPSVDQLNKVNFSAPIEEMRARYAIEENSRVRDFLNAVEVDKVDMCGDLLYASHAGLSKQYEVSCAELDFLVDCLRDDNSVLGSRMMGGGFGGCTINLVRTEAITEIKDKVAPAYDDAFGIAPQFYEVAISAGAGIIS